jgi:hypothetical protein
MSIKEPGPPIQPLFIPPDAPEPDPEITDIPDPFMPKSTAKYEGKYESPPIKLRKKRGAQPGNRNSLKHGLYIQSSHVRNTNPIEKAVLYDLSDSIKYAKDYMRFLYEMGLKTTSIYEANDTMRSLAISMVGLCRLINVHNRFSAIPLPAEMMHFDDTEPTFDELIEKLKAEDPRLFDLINEEK